MTALLSFLAGAIVGGLATLAAIVIWAVRGSKWLVSGK